MTDASGTVVWSADYKPFGEATVTVSTITNNLRFPGQYYDAETGLYYNYFRDYNPAIGRYMQADPIGLSGGINLYSYAKANPLKFKDLRGLKCTFNLFQGSGSAKLIISGTLGIAAAECDCFNGLKTKAKYAIFSIGLTGGGGIDLPEVPINFSPGDFTTNHNTPPTTVKYLQVNGPSASFGACVGIGDFQVSISPNGPGQGQAFVNEPCAAIGASLFEVAPVLLLKIQGTEKSEPCCKSSH